MSNYRFETKQIHVGQEQADPATDSRAVPIYQTTSYVFHNSQHAADRFGLADAGNIYGRLTNSTQEVLEKRIAALEGGSAALAVASGAAAITYTIEALAANGGHIVAQKTIYGGSYNLLAHTLPQYGISTTFVDAHDLDELTAAIKDDTRAIYLETLGNPNSDIPDIDAIAEIAHRHGLPVVVDNTFGTPYLIRPIEHGADIVVHSATKFLGGHGTTLGGVIVESGKFDWKAGGKYPQIAAPNPSYHGVSFYDAVGAAAFVTYIRAILLRDTGAAISPFNAFLLLQGVETLSLRLERHAENTAKVVEYLSKHPLVEKVNHPSLPDHPDHALYEKYFPNGGASIFTFDIKGGREEAWKFIDALEIFSLLGISGSGHLSEYDPPVDRYRAYRRYHRRSGERIQSNRIILYSKYSLYRKTAPWHPRRGRFYSKLLLQSQPKSIVIAKSISGTPKRSCVLGRGDMTERYESGHA